MTSQKYYPNDYIVFYQTFNPEQLSAEGNTAENVQNCQHIEALLCLAMTVRVGKSDLYSLVPKQHMALPLFNSFLKVCSIRN